MNKEINAKLKYICSRFCLPGDLVVHFDWIPKGHINMAYRVSLEDGEEEKQVLLQKVNWYVYRDPVSMMQNIGLITQHLMDKRQRCLHYYCSRAGRPYLILREEGRDFIDLEDIPEEQRADALTDTPWEAGWEFWRASDYVENSVTFESAEADAQVLKRAGAAFGSFVRLLTDFDAAQLVESIPHFHDTPYRLESLLGILAFDPLGRAGDAAEEIREIRNYRDFAGTLYRSDLPVRVTHNDTKLNNILFDKDTLEPIVIIDLDTCMPGHACYDFGDSIRFAACTADKKLDLDLFRAYAEGYLSEMKALMTGEELESLAPSAAVITLELACRYLEDYLIGDKYFRTDHPGQNLERARAQLGLFRDMMLHMDEMKRIIAELAEKKNNIVLVGMPASGKSTVGMELAKALGYDFIDTDIRIQEQKKARLEELIEAEGIEGFLDIESRVCASLDVSHTVIATGGSVIYRDKAMRHLKEIGTVVYMKLPLESLELRLQDMKQRGVVLKEGQSLADLYLERTQLYEKFADITVEESEHGPEETVEAALGAICRMEQ